MPSALAGRRSSPAALDERRLLQVERALLAQLADGDPAEQILEQLVRGIEWSIAGVVGSVLLVDGEAQDRLRLGAAPSLPEPVAAASDGFPIGPNLGTCGVAAYTRQPVYTHDVREDPAWAGIAEVAAGEGLISCWSVPILGRDGKLLGTFAVYRSEPGLPDSDRVGLLESYAKLAALSLDLSQSREALKQREHLFEAAAKAISQAIWDLDIPKRTLRWHPADDDPFGLTDEELEDLDGWVARIHPEDRARVSHSLDQATSRGDDRWSASYRFQKADGSFVWVIDRGRTVYDSSGRPLRMVGGLSDDGARREAELRLREQAEVLDQVQSAIIVADIEGRVTVWNRSAARLYWIPAEQAEGRTLSEAGVVSDLPFADLLQILLAEGRRSSSVQLTRPGGEVRELRSMWRLVRDSEGCPRSVVLVQTDETSRLRMERRQLRAQRLESIGTLAGGVAHDLNNMLTPILASIELLRLKISEPSALDNLLIMEGAAQRGADMVRQLLQFARGAEAERGPVDVGLLLSEILRISRDTLPRSIRLHIEQEPDLPTVLGDKTQLHQILLNLVINARDAMPDGGEITLSSGLAEILPEHLPHLSSLEARAGTYVKIGVEDTGTGIPPEVLERIFEPFFTTKGVGVGTGLGLPTVLTLVRAHKGFIELFTEAGKGTRICVFLPVAVAGRERPIQHARSGPQLPVSGERVLVVDDELAVRQIACRLLEQAGYVVVEASDGVDALSEIDGATEPFACVVTDLMMPHLDGYGLIRELAASSPTTAVVAVTGLDRGDARERVLAAGAHAFLGKPFTGPALVECVGTAIQTVQQQALETGAR